MCRFSVLTFYFRMVGMPCSTGVVTRRGVSVCTCVDVKRMVVGLYVTFVLRLFLGSELILCTFLMFVSSILFFFVGGVMYIVGCGCYGCGFC